MVIRGSRIIRILNANVRNLYVNYTIEKARLQQFNEARKNSSLPKLPIHVLESKIRPPSIDPIASDKIPLQPSNQKIFDHVAVGGTFDHLHLGHKILLTMTAWITGKR